MSTLDTRADELDRLFDALSQPERRQVLRQLGDTGSRDEALTLDELTATADHEHQRLQTELYHRHLPKLDDAGYVAWRPDSRTIHRGPRFEDIEPVIELLDDHRDELP